MPGSGSDSGSGSIQVRPSFEGSYATPSPEYPASCYPKTARTTSTEAPNPTRSAIRPAGSACR
jgi:hypothetical protein